MTTITDKIYGWTGTVLGSIGLGAGLSLISQDPKQSPGYITALVGVFNLVNEGKTLVKYSEEIKETKYLAKLQYVLGPLCREMEHELNMNKVNLNKGNTK